MRKSKCENGSITLFVLVAFIFCMIMLISIYWNSTNNQIAILQAEQKIQQIYGLDVNNVESIYQEIKSKEERLLEEEHEAEEVEEEGPQITSEVNDETSSQTSDELQVSDEPQVNDEPNIETTNEITNETKPELSDESNNKQNNNL